MQRNDSAKTDRTSSVVPPIRLNAPWRVVAVVLGAVQWPTSADLAPDAMYDAIREHWRWVLVV